MHPLLQEALDRAPRDAPPIEQVATEHRLAIPGGSIRLLHARPTHPVAGRPVVMVPGFGVLPPGWHDWWAVLRGRVEVFYIETREKPTSTLEPGADLSMEALVHDVAAGLEYFGLRGADVVLQGTSWGSSTILAGLASGAVSAETVLAWNIVPHLHFSRWALRHITPWLPFWVFGVTRDLISSVVFAGMEPAQRARLESFVKTADWRWKAAAEAQVDFELGELAPQIAQEVLVVVGVDEKVHSAEVSAELAALMPRGRLLTPAVSPAVNTRVGGIFALELAQVAAGAPLPAMLQAVEQPLTAQRARTPTPPA